MVPKLEVELAGSGKIRVGKHFVFRFRRPIFRTDTSGLSLLSSEF